MQKEVWKGSREGNLVLRKGQMLSQRARSRSRNRSSVESCSPISMAATLSLLCVSSSSASWVQAGAKIATEQPRSYAIFTACNNSSLSRLAEP